jgi:hypothetical protein
LPGGRECADDEQLADLEDLLASKIGTAIHSNGKHTLSSLKILLNFDEAVSGFSLCTHPSAGNPNTVHNVVDNDASNQAGFGACFLEMEVEI